MTPVALFAYNRPAHVALALESLSRCDRLGECRVYVYCDGPKGPGEAGAVEATRRVVREWVPKLDAEVVEREANLGLARSIATGVTDLCARFGRVIVVEDDFVVSPDFLDYMLQALDRYADMADVYQVSGYMFPVEHPREPDAFFLPLTTTRGWATWARAWRAFDWDATGAAEALADPEMRRAFDLDGAYPYAAMLEDRLAGRNDSWGILWWWAVFRAGGLVLHPRRSLVWVGGMDGTGTHCGTDADFRQPARDTFAVARLGHPLHWPERVAANSAALARVHTHLGTRRSVARRLLARIRRALTLRLA